MADTIRLHQSDETDPHLLQMVGATLEAISDALYVTDLNGKPLIHNKRFVEIIGLDLDPLVGLGQAHVELLKRELKDPEQFFARLEELDADPELEVADVLEFNNGRHIERCVRPLRIDGEVMGRLFTFRDITETYAAERKLIDAAARLEGIVSSAMDAIVSVDEEQNITLFNCAAEEIFGYSAKEALGQPLDILIPERFRAGHRLHVERFGAGGETARSMHGLQPLAGRRRDGEEFPVEATISQARVDGRVIYTAIMRDVSERLRIDQVLRESEALLEEGQRIANMGNWTLDLQTRSMLWSRQVYAVMGVEDDGNQISLERAASTMHPADRHMVDEGMVVAIETGTPFTAAYRVRCPDGAVRWVSTTGQVIYADDGTPVRISGVSMDITEMKRAEEERARLENQLLQTQKLEAVGTLAGGIAHDFNNILFAIQGFAEMVYDALPEGSPSREDQLEVLSAARRATELVRQILTFSRRTSSSNRAPVRVGSLVKEVSKLLRASIPTTIELRQELDAPDATVLADPIELHQVLMNLCTNASHAIGDNIGRLTIGLRYADAPLEVKETDAPYCLLSVTDTGHGIEPENMERLFEPFFTTKEIGEGTGLGLSTVHGIVANLGGAVHVYSEVDVGTTFNVYLPLAEGEEEYALAQELQRGTERILVVDDEAPLARLLQVTLSELGYEVVALTDPRKALELLQTDPSAFDLVLCDETMPGLRGSVLAGMITELRADLPVILCTGYAHKVGEELAQVRRVLAKPVSRLELSHAVRSVLDS